MADNQDIAPDQLPGCPHPRENRQLFGQLDAERRFLESGRHGRLHHAWLMFGKEGIGKATLAYRIADFVLGGGAEALAEQEFERVPVGHSQHDSHLVATDAHPNLLVLRRGWNAKTKQYSASISIDNVRELQHFLGSTAGMGRWRTVIIDRADDLNVSAANALLKMLEEPPAYCLFLLVSSRPGSLPTTIRSRCQKLRMEPLAEPDLRQAVQAVAATGDIELPVGKDADLLLQMAEGSPRLALELAGGNTMQLYREVEAILDLLPRVDPQKSIELAERLSAKTAAGDFETFMHLLSTLLARRVRELILAGQGAKTALAQWAELWETVTATRNQVERLNLDRGNFILDMFTRMEAVAREHGGLGSSSAPAS